ncbi:hypothetical protein ARMSODRAFT_975925 [Armillaria solidipes]|uniref:DUF6535 domain-containing protein n=1 Tax=Armillaria solidipes TaxID=1076256 RepID=A0A2H3BCD9_9AGAR|nr:hypothetical protein ARMSODRAFT_975925 [Armillaria solidipes]
MDSQAQETVGSSEAQTTHRCHHQEGETCTSSQEDLSVHWRRCYSTLTEHDSKVVSSWTDEMNMVLIFASLYSAVVTAFLVESYQRLSADPVEALLSRISSQLDPSTNSSSFKPSYTPSSSDVAINAAWFSSLVLALSAVLITILVKQWLYHYSWMNSPVSGKSPRVAMALRHLSYTSLTSGVIYYSVVCPSLLLIISLFLFFAGLIILLWTLNSIIAGLVTILTSCTTVYFLATTIAPSFNPNSICRSSQAWYFYHLVSAWRSIFTCGRIKNDVITWTEMSLKFLGHRSSEYLSYALLWVHDHAIVWDLPCMQSVWKCSKSLDDETALQVLCDVYLNSPPTPYRSNYLSKEYTNIWRVWIADKEIEEMYEFLLRTFPDNCWTAMSPKRIQNRIVTFCSLHFGIEYHHGRAFTIFTGLNNLADLLSPTDVRLASLVREDGTSMSVADIKEGIAYTINFAITEHWSGTCPAISTANTADILASRMLTILIDASCAAVAGRTSATDTTGDTFYFSVNAAINLIHFISVQLDEPGRVSDEQLSKLLGAMEAFPASTDVEVADKKWYLQKVWAPTLFRYNGKSVWDMWAAREGLKFSEAMIKLLAVLDSPPLDTDIYDPADPPDILMLYMLYGKKDQRNSVYLHGAELAGVAREEYHTAVGARWWQQRLTPSEISSVIHSLIDELAPLNSTTPDEQCFAVLCALISVHTTDDEAMAKIGSLFASRIDACLSSSASSTSTNVLHADIRSWSQTLVRVLSNPETVVDLQATLIPKVLSSLVRYAKSNYISGGEITASFISSSAVALQLGCQTPCYDVLDGMKELTTSMAGSIEGDHDTQVVKDARKRWKEVIDLPQVIPQRHLEDAYALLEKSIRSH